MNQLTELYRYILQLANEDVLINSVYRGAQLELVKDVVTPALTVDIATGGFSNGQTIFFNIELGVFCQRDVSKVINTDDFFRNDNEVDNQNLAIATLNRVWTKIFRDFDERNYSTTENPSFELGSALDTTKLLDGAKMNFSVELPNETLSLCQ